MAHKSKTLPKWVNVPKREFIATGSFKTAEIRGWNGAVGTIRTSMYDGWEGLKSVVLTFLVSLGFVRPLGT